jgi:Zn-dependent alcohol dehydrogenase
VDRGVVLSPDGRVAVEELQLEPPGAGEALVRIEASGVCHTDLHIIRTGGWRQVPPIVLGHEGAGVVEAVGEGVHHVGVGDRVVVGWRSPCGECPWCRRGARHLCRTPPGPGERMRLSNGSGERRRRCPPSRHV